MGKIEKLKYRLDNGDISSLTFYRELANLSVDELASKLDPPITPATLRKFENKNVKFSKHIARQIAKELNVEVELLLAKKVS